MGAYARKVSKKDLHEEIEKIYEMFPRLAERRQQFAGTLSGGEQQMLAIGRALMAKPQLLILDEPSMGLAPIVVKSIFSTINKIKQEGLTILLIEQNATMALSVADRGYVLENGEIHFHDSAKNLRERNVVKKAYLG
jgi:branched-chain amino acid transport system ATP-binding protein